MQQLKEAAGNGYVESGSDRSKLANELSRLPRRQRTDLGLSDSTLMFVDALVSISQRLVCSDSFSEIPALLDEELARIFPDTADAGEGSETSLPFLQDLQEGELEAKLQGWLDSGQLRWLKVVSGNNHWTRFLRKLVGAARFDSIVVALKHDAAIVVAAVRRLSCHLEPFAVAFDDMVSILPEKERDAIATLSPKLVGSSLQLMLHFGSAIDELVESDFDFREFEAKLKSSPSVAADVATTITECRNLLAAPLQQRLGQLNDGFVRKISGAKFALDNSMDGVSQASNSIIELIDRVLRQAFTDDFVLQWLKDVGRSGSDVTYSRDGRALPTKFAQALCLVYGGVLPEQPSVIHDAAARCLVTARSELQRLEHADDGTAEEIDRLRECLSAVEGCLTLVIRLGWSGLSPDAFDGIRGRLAA